MYKINEGKINDDYCIFNPKFVKGLVSKGIINKDLKNLTSKSDGDYIDSIFKIYEPEKIYKITNEILSNELEFPDPNLIKKDPILANLILNSWFSSDTALYSSQKVYYNKDLSIFTYNGIKYYLRDGGLGLSSNTYTDKSGKVITNKYIYMPNANLLSLPAQLYISNLKRENNSLASDQTFIQIQKGKQSTLNLTPICSFAECSNPGYINTANDLEVVLNDIFYNFLINNRKTCDNLDADSQKKNDAICKFFTPQSGSLGGIVVTLRRVLVQNLLPSVVFEYKNNIEEKLKRGDKLDYLEFFLWLSCLSYTLKVNYDFIEEKL